MEAPKKTSRGIRNNNPLNLRRSNNNWRGKVTTPSDPAFEQFISMGWGIRAALINARTIMRRHAPCSLKQLISVWAPPTENNTYQYIVRVCRSTGYQPEQILNFKNKRMMCMVIWAMAIVECGTELDYDLFERAYEII